MASNGQRPRAVECLNHHGRDTTSVLRVLSLQPESVPDRDSTERRLPLRSRADPYVDPAPLRGAGGGDGRTRTAPSVLRWWLLPHHREPGRRKDLLRQSGNRYAGAISSPSSIPAKRSEEHTSELQSLRH